MPEIPRSQAAELAAERDRRDTQAVQLRWRPIGHGCVELVLENLPHGFTEALVKGNEPTLDGRHAMVLRLAYPQQGQLVGSPPIDEANAGKLNAATLELNRVLDELYAR